MTDAPGHTGDLTCTATLAALARGGADADWDAVERHLAGCADCAAGVERLTAAIDEQFAASASLLDLDGSQPATDAMAVEEPRVVPFRRPIASPAATPARPPATRRDWWRRPGFGIAGGLVAAALVAAVVLVARHGGGPGAEAGRRPEFVTSLDVLPARPDHTYFAGEQVQVCVTIKQPSRIHLSELAGHATFDLYDADSDPGEHCFPERVGALRGPATLRVEVFYGKERVAREDFPLLPATATPAARPPSPQ